MEILRSFNRLIYPYLYFLQPTRGAFAPRVFFSLYCRCLTDTAPNHTRGFICFCFISLASRKRKPPFIFFYSRSQARKKAPKQIIFRQKGSEDLQMSKLQKMHFYHKSPTKNCKFGIFFVPLRHK